LISAPAEPVRWLGGTGASDLVMHRALYRADPWVTVFLDRLTDYLPVTDLGAISLNPRRRALVLTGQTATGALRVAEALYRDVLLFHPGLHPAVEDLLGRAVADATAELAHRGFVEGDELRRHGRRALVDHPSLLLHGDVVSGLDALGVSGLPAVGVSGLVEVRTPTGDYLLASLRSDRVAVNPGCLAPPVDGGIDRHGGDPRAELRRELKDELPWDLGDVEWLLTGVVLPQREGSFLGPTRTRRAGVNLLYRTEIKADRDRLLRTASSHFESDGMVLIELAPPVPGNLLPTVWACRNGTVTPLDVVPAISEVLAASLARLGLVELTSEPAQPDRSSIPTSGSARSEAAMSLTAINRSVTVGEHKQPPPPPVEPSLEDAWAEQLLSRYPRIYNVINDTSVLDLREKQSGPGAGGLDPVMDAIREYELVCRSNQLENVDEARLFEAVVVALSRNLFANQQSRALDAYEFLEDIRSPEIGAVFQARLQAVIDLDAEEGVASAKAKKAAAATRTRAFGLGVPMEQLPSEEVVSPESIVLDDDEQRRAIEIPNEVARRLRQLDTDEAATAYSEIKRRSQLLCFCAALWSVESKRSTAAADVALDERFRRTLTGDAVALFFRARALLVSPVASTAQTQLGLQFVTTALSYFPTNPGMHHTRALFLLRKSSTIVGSQESIECLEQALTSVEEALKWDAEFAVFYATRAKVKYRMHNRSGALVDIRAAIELARYGTLSSAASRDIRGWEALLESWDLAPVGVASGGGD
jgi:hypothetical protein